MIKRISVVSLCILLFSGMFVPGATADYVIEEEEETRSISAPGIDLAPNAKSAILIDAHTGTVIYEKNQHEKLPPASITKVMTMLLIMEAIEEGTLTYKDKVGTSEFAASMGGSQIFLEAGEQMTVEEMLKGIAMASGNDASVAMAEKISGSEELFVERMNKKAKELGLENTHFANSNGLPADNHYSSAHDIAFMSKALLDHKDITRYTGKYQDYLRKDTDDPFWLVNTNKLVRFYDGADGLKTGYTSEAKYCLAATAIKDDLRVIAVVMGEPNTKTRNAEVSKMFDYAFSQYKHVSLIEKGEPIGTVELNKASVEKLELIAPQNYSLLMKRSDPSDEIRHELKLNEKLELPVKKGQEIGKLHVYNGEKQIESFSIVSPFDIDKANWWTLLKRTGSKLFFLD